MGQDFFQQQLNKDDLILLHPHPRMLVPALRYAARFGMRAVVVFYVWYSLWSTHLILKGGHLPLAATNISVCYLTFLGGLRPQHSGERGTFGLLCSKFLCPQMYPLKSSWL